MAPLLHCLNWAAALMNVACESNTIHHRAQLEGVFSRYSWTLISLHPSSPILVCIAENLMDRVRLSLCVPHCQLLIESVRRFFAGGKAAQKPPLSHSIYIFRLLRQFPMLSIWWGFTRQGRWSFSSFSSQDSFFTSPPTITGLKHISISNIWSRNIGNWNWITGCERASEQFV